jgi:hypothetical protein
MEGEWILRSCKGSAERNWEHFSSTARHKQIHLPQKALPTKDLSILQCDVHLIAIISVRTLEIAERRAGTAKRHLHHPSRSAVTLHTILLGVGGIIYNYHTLEPFN